MKICNECGSFVIAPQNYEQRITTIGTEDLNGTDGIRIYILDTCLTCGSTDIGFREDFISIMPKVEPEILFVSDYLKKRLQRKPPKATNRR